MPVTYTLRSGLMILKPAGEYAPNDLVAGFHAGMEDPACPNPVALLIDMRESQSFATRSVAEIRGAAEYIGAYAPRVGGRVAVLVGSDVQFGLARMGSVFSEGVGVEAEVFRDEIRALAWLGVPSGPVRA
jgi:hypothetical protein